MNLNNVNVCTLNSCYYSFISIEIVFQNSVHHESLTIVDNDISNFNIQNTVRCPIALSTLIRIWQQNGLRIFNIPSAVNWPIPLSPFRILKCVFGFRKACYRGIAKNHNRLQISFALVNLYMKRRTLMRYATAWCQSYARITPGCDNIEYKRRWLSQIRPAIDTMITKFRCGFQTVIYSEVP